MSISIIEFAYNWLVGIRVASCTSR